MIYYKERFNAIYHGDSRELIGRLDDKSIQMVVSSPPCYYEDGKLQNMAVNPDKYAQFNVDILRLIKKPLHDTGVVFWHIEDKNDLGIPDIVARAIVKDGWLLQDTIELVGLDEFIFVLTKQDDYGWNEMNYGNKWSIPIEIAGVYLCGKCSKFYDHTNIGEILSTTKDGSGMCPCGSMEFISHTGAFAEELPKRCIEMGSRQWVDTVLDPFAGSGTTGVAGRKLRRKVILIDDKEDFCEMAKERIKRTEYLMDCERFGWEVKDD